MGFVAIGTAFLLGVFGRKWWHGYAFCGAAGIVGMIFLGGGGFLWTATAAAAGSAVRVVVDLILGRNKQDDEPLDEVFE